MTAISETAEPVGPGGAGARAEGFELGEAWWGYVVRSTEPATPLQVALQAVAALLGAGAAAAAVGLWALAPEAGGLAVMKLGASVVLGCVAALLLWFASRGDRPEYHFDTSLGEVREVVRNRAGRPTLLSRHRFDRLDRVALGAAGRHRGVRRFWLVLKLADGDELVVVRGPETALRRLAERVSADIRQGSLKAAQYEAVYPIERSRPAAAQ